MYKSGCLVCGKEVLTEVTPLEQTCDLCGKSTANQFHCQDGHFVCKNCHIKGVIESAIMFCNCCNLRDPVEIIKCLMELPDIDMHNPEHHALVGVALLTAYSNCSGDIDLGKALNELCQRFAKFPASACTQWGCCGAAVSTGTFVSIITSTGSQEQDDDSYCIANAMTGQALTRIASVNGSRCCKRASFLAIEAAAEFCAERLGVKMEMPPAIICTHSNDQRICQASHCPYNPNLNKGHNASVI